MQNNPNMLLLAVSSSLLMMLGAQSSSAQVTNPIKASITHRFIIGNTTFPPGQYTFRMMPDSDLSVMTARSPDGNTADEFLVREAKAPNTPDHSELIFNQYGNKQLLSKVYEQGSRIGVAVVEPSREELRLQKHGQHPIEHVEEQK
jgi:hypothetical protein